MNNNSIEITSYLQGEMAADEKIAFEARLAGDTALKDEVNIQRQIIEAAISAGLKAIFAKGIRRRIMNRRLIGCGIIIVIGIVVILLYQGRNKNLKSTAATGQYSTATAQSKSQLPFINPPLPKINVPISEYSFDAGKGDTIFYPSGSIIYFPPSALIDERGNLITGTVKITYREFAVPIDFFVSGIPMRYDSAGIKYNFESSGMCEINAYKDDKPAFVNPYAKPQVNLSGNNRSPLHNLYFLDTVARQWKFIGKDRITEVRNISQSKNATPIKASTENIQVEGMTLLKPVKPAMASADKQAFSLEIDPNSFEELYAYDHLKFEVVDESTYRRSDADEHWDDVKLERTILEGIYNITFSNTRRKVTYKVRPVLEGADYDAAIKIFNEKNKVYETALKNRVTHDRMAADTIAAKNKQVLEKMNADKTWNDRVNAFIMERNKQLKEQQQRIIANDLKRESQLQNILEKRGIDRGVSLEIMRTFAINNFGIWNCDHPEYPNNEIPILAYYTDSANHPIQLPNVAIVYKGFNGITQFPYAAQIRVIPGQQNMLWSIMDGSFYYFTYKDFATAGINGNNTNYIFKMRKSEKPVNSYEQIRQLADKL